MKCLSSNSYYLPRLNGKSHLERARHKSHNYTLRLYVADLEFIQPNFNTPSDVKYQDFWQSFMCTNLQNTYSYMQLQVPHDYKEDFPAVDTTAAVVESRTVTSHLSVTHFA